MLEKEDEEVKEPVQEFLLCFFFAYAFAFASAMLQNLFNWKSIERQINIPKNVSMNSFLISSLSWDMTSTPHPLLMSYPSIQTYIHPSPHLTSLHFTSTIILYLLYITLLIWYKFCHSFFKRRISSTLYIVAAIFLPHIKFDKSKLKSQDKLSCLRSTSV